MHFDWYFKTSIWFSEMNSGGGGYPKFLWFWCFECFVTFSTKNLRELSKFVVLILAISFKKSQKIPKKNSWNFANFVKMEKLHFCTRISQKSLYRSKIGQFFPNDTDFSLNTFFQKCWRRKFVVLIPKNSDCDVVRPPGQGPLALFISDDFHLKLGLKSLRSSVKQIKNGYQDFDSTYLAFSGKASTFSLYSLFISIILSLFLKLFWSFFGLWIDFSYGFRKFLRDTVENCYLSMWYWMSKYNQRTNKE